jgi:hypothetical protein
MSGSADLYRVLQVEPHVDAEAIQAAYRRLARLYHPDLNREPGAAERMRAVNAAYRVLSDPAQRAAYDASRYLPRVQPTQGVYRRTAPITPRPTIRATPPTELQRRVDRVVGIIGVLLLLAIGFYVVSVWPTLDRLSQEERGLATRVVPTRAVSNGAEQSADHPVGSIPQRLRSDGRLRSFPGTVLVAPESLPPFSSLPVQRIDGTGAGIARYAVYYGDWSTGGATISGLMGRSAFDGNVPRLPNCGVDDAYCVGPAPGQTTGNGLELFRAPDLVDDYPAIASHRVCCNGTFWTIAWYEPRANVSYTLDLSRNLAVQYGGSTLGEDNLNAARGVAALARKLVRLP